MKEKVILTITLLIFWVPGMARAEVPHEVGGFALNRNIQDYKEQVIMDTALPVRYAENIEEVEIKVTKGFKSGLIAYGTCATPGNIVRIKLKYADSSKPFFEELLKRFKKSFGQPDEYRGDAFKVMIAWKWSFVDQQNHNISLILQHNSMDEEEKMGNAVKMTDQTLMEEDLSCYKDKQRDHRERLRQRQWNVVNPKESSWELFVPR